MRALLVEDDPVIAGNMAQAMRGAGFVVQHAKCGDEAWFMGCTESFAVVVLDLTIPGLDGMSVLRRWRRDGHEMPVLIVTARGAWVDRVAGIDAGADDYLPKPFQNEELLARLRALIRRFRGRGSPIMQAGGVTCDPRTMSVSTANGPVSLTALEYRLVAYLLHRRGQTVSQAELVDHVYGVDHHTSNAIEVLVGRVRKKLGSLIVTRRGFGYIVPEAAE